MMPPHADTSRSSVAAPAISAAVFTRSIAAMTVIATAATGGIPHAAQIRQKMVHRRKAAGDEKRIDLPIAGAANHVQLAERVECRTLFQVEAAAPPEGGHSMLSQDEHVLPGQRFD